MVGSMRATVGSSARSTQRAKGARAPRPSTAACAYGGAAGCFAHTLLRTGTHTRVGCARARLRVGDAAGRVGCARSASPHAAPRRTFIHVLDSCTAAGSWCPRTHEHEHYRVPPLGLCRAGRAARHRPSGAPMRSARTRPCSVPIQGRGAGRSGGARSTQHALPLCTRMSACPPGAPTLACKADGAGGGCTPRPARRAHASAAVQGCTRVRCWIVAQRGHNGASSALQ